MQTTTTGMCDKKELVNCVDLVDEIKSVNVDTVNFKLFMKYN
jgi:hypothetical protein